jgi:hypothetical protein
MRGVHRTIHFEADLLLSSGCGKDSSQPVEQTALSSSQTPGKVFCERVKSLIDLPEKRKRVTS